MPRRLPPCHRRRRYFRNAINATLFFSCARRPPNLNLIHIACLSNTSDSQESYYNLPKGNDHQHVSEYAKNCKSIVLILSYGNMVGPENNFLKVLQDVFGLNWIVGDGGCGESGDCVHSGGVCGNDLKMPREQPCFCRDGSISSGPVKKNITGSKEVKRMQTVDQPCNPSLQIVYQRVSFSIQ